MKRLLALTVVLVSTAAFVPSIATAADSPTVLTISIRQPLGKSFGAFGGRVRSTRVECQGNRTVTLKRKSPGAASFTDIGSDTSVPNGHWGVPTKPIVGAQYRAKVPARNLGGGDRCKGATSKTVTARATSSPIAIGVPLGDRFEGTVNSAVTSCESQRHVVLQRALPGGSFTSLATTTADGSGAWAVPTDPVDNARYKGFVFAKQVGPDACIGASTPVTTARSSAVTIAQGGSTNFHGRVNAIPACEPNRTVTLQRRASANPMFSNVGSDVTDGGGAWLVSTAVVSGDLYRASTGAEQNGAESCLDDLSSVIVAG